MKKILQEPVWFNLYPSLFDLKIFSNISLIQHIFKERISWEKDSFCPTSEW